MQQHDRTAIPKLLVVNGMPVYRGIVAHRHFCLRLLHDTLSVRPTEKFNCLKRPRWRERLGLGRCDVESLPEEDRIIECPADQRNNPWGVARDNRTLHMRVKGGCIHVVSCV